jgi:cytochrome c2
VFTVQRNGRTHRLLVVSAVFFYLIVPFNLFSGVAVVRRGTSSSSLINAARAEDAQKPDASPANSSPVEDALFSSWFVPLARKFVSIPPPEREGGGGAVTSWGKYIVLITHEGKLYFVDADLNVTQSKIAAPLNGFDDYFEMAQRAPYDTREHYFGNFRFNDIAHVNVGNRQALLVAYTKYDKERTCYTTTVSRLIVEDPANDILNYSAAPGDWAEIFQTSPCLPLKETWRPIEGHMAGSRMAYDGERTVFLTSGDYHWDGVYGPRTRPGVDPEHGPAVAQDTNADYGKVIAIDVVTGKAHHLARGLRNMQGIARDAKGRIWTVEHGVNGGDELNLIVKGKNYGWPLESYGTLYSGLPLPTKRLGRHEKFQQPVFAWIPSIAVSGLMQVSGFHEAWDGDLLAGTLVSESLVRIRIADNRVVLTEAIQVGHRVRHVHQHTDGRIVLWTDEQKLIVLSPGFGGLGFEYVKSQLEHMDDRDLAASVGTAIRDCMTCHSLDPGPAAKAPPLGKVFGSRVGSGYFGKYSQALKSEQRVWTRELLAEYLLDPQSAIPGTSMPNPDVPDERLRDKVIDLLQGLATTLE